MTLGAAIPFSRPARRLLLTLAAAALVAPLAAFGTAAAAARAATGSGQVPHYRHIVVIMFTDHSYADILNNSYAPTFNRLARDYGLATRYSTTSDPDTAGMMAFLAGNSYGVNDGSPYWDQPRHGQCRLLRR
jgi:ABC-type sugar transport system substrate-binding protein